MINFVYYRSVNLSLYETSGSPTLINKPGYLLTIHCELVVKEYIYMKMAADKLSL